MLSFKLDSDTKFDFSMQIVGDAESPTEPEVLFVICYGDYRYGFKATYQQNGQYSVIVPSLKGQLPPGVHKAAVWVLIGDRFYKPHESDVEFKMDLKPVVTDFKGASVKPTDPSISFSTGATTPSPVTMINMPQQTAEEKKEPVAPQPATPPTIEQPPTGPTLEDFFGTDLRGLRLSKFIAKNDVTISNKLDELVDNIMTLLSKQTHDYKADEVKSIAKRLCEFKGVKFDEVKLQPKPSEMLEKLLYKKKKK
jgi:hypothetical protein